MTTEFDDIQDDEQESADKSFPTILTTTFDDEEVSIANLYYLTDLMGDNLMAFREKWKTADSERQQSITRHLADLSQEIYRLDFGKIFELGLVSDHVDVKLAALDGLSDSENTRLVDPILALMKDKEQDHRVRTIAAATLGHYVLLAEWGQVTRQVGKKIVQALMAVIDDSETQEPTYRAALESVSSADHPRINDLIDKAYNDGKFEMALTAVFAMGQSANKRWLNTILDEMESENEEMRVEAARAAGMLGNSAAVPPLAEMVWDQDIEVRTAAIISLGQIGSQEAKAILTDISEDEEMEDLFDVIDESLEEMDMQNDYDFDDLFDGNELLGD